LDYRKAKLTGNKNLASTILWRAGFVVNNIIAETLIMLSSKGHGQGVVSDNSVKDSVIALAADMICREPKEMHPQLITTIANFLQRPEVFAEKGTRLADQLQTRVQQQLGNPWACHAEEHSQAPVDPVVQEPTQKVSAVPTSWVERHQAHLSSPASVTLPLTH
jgi:hypothetical protein